MADIKTFFQRQKGDLYPFNSLLLKWYKRDIARPIYKTTRKRLKLPIYVALFVAAFPLWWLYLVALTSLSYDIFNIIFTLLNWFFWSLGLILLHKNYKLRRKIIHDRLIMLNQLKRGYLVEYYLLNKLNAPTPANLKRKDELLKRWIETDVRIKEFKKFLK